jgi:hypothetical protein
MKLRWIDWTLTTYLPLTIGYNMGWQKRSSGHRYDSHDGHAFPMGFLTKMPIGCAIMNKHCRICTNSEHLGMHDCTANFVGASGAMESAALVQLAHSLL